MTQSGYAAIASALIGNGADVMFGVMGEGNLDLISEWSGTLGRRYVAARHEAAAVAMATGYAHVAGSVGVCTVTHGPGLANAVTALRSAVRARLPVLLVAGDLAQPADPAHPQYADQRALVEPTGAVFIELASPADAPDAVDEALEMVAARSTPVVLNAPVNVQAALWQSLPDPAAPRGWMRPAQEPAAADQVMAAARLLAQAEAPVVLAGEGAYRSGAGPALIVLAEYLGALLATSLKAKDFFRGHPLDAGLSGGFAPPETRSLLTGSDCVAAFGASMNQWTTAHGAMFPSATVIHCDVANDAIGAVTPVSQPLIGDAQATAHSLLDAVRTLTEPQTARRERREHEVRRLREEQCRNRDDSKLAGQRAMVVLDQLLPADRALVVDGGHFMGYPATEVSVPGPREFLWTSHFGSIGLGLGTAIGAAVARAPASVTVLVAGDGGLTMSLGELETVARSGLPLVVVAMNDSAYGAEVHFLRHRGRPPDSALFTEVNLAEVARSLGMTAFRVRDTEVDLKATEHTIRNCTGPVFIEVVLSPDEVAPWFSGYLNGAH